MLDVTPTPTFFEVRFQYKEDLKNAVKSITGAQWNALYKYWAIPLNQKARLDYIGLQWGGVLYRRERKSSGAMIPELPNLTIHIPLLHKLKPFQEQGAAAGLMWQRFINADEMGLGKTVQSIATAIGGGCKCVLIICPASLKYNWQREWKKWTGKNAMLLEPDIKTSWHRYYTTGMCNVFICNYESLRTYFVDSMTTNDKGKYDSRHIVFKDEISMFDCVIIDEVHNLKNTATQRYLITQGLVWGKKYVMCLTGSPIVNRAKDILAPLKLTGRLHLFGGYTQFIKKYCTDDPAALRELQQVLFSTCFFRRLKKDVAKELPEKTYQLVQCDITNRKEYNKALADLENYLREYKNCTEEQIKKSMAGHAFVKIQACRNIAARGKMEAAKEMIDEVIDSGNKIVVYVYQREVALMLLKMYPHAVTVTGADDIKARDSAVEAFQNVEACNIIIVSIKAGGVGLTLTAASNGLFIEWPWHPTDVDQCADRMHRIGQINAVLARFLLARNTIDEFMYELIESKRYISNIITGSEEGFQRQVLDLLADSLFKNKTLVV